jgi:hypothetical protein
MKKRSGFTHGFTKPAVRSASSEPPHNSGYLASAYETLWSPDNEPTDEIRKSGEDRPGRELKRSA